MIIILIWLVDNLWISRGLRPTENRPRNASRRPSDRAGRHEKNFRGALGRACGVVKNFRGALRCKKKKKKKAKCEWESFSSMIFKKTNNPCLRHELLAKQFLFPWKVSWFSLMLDYQPVLSSEFILFYGFASIRGKRIQFLHE
jgi:hypothetical protein